MESIRSLTGDEFEDYTKQNFPKVYSMLITKGLIVKDDSTNVPWPFGTSNNGELGIAVYTPGEYFGQVIEEGSVFAFKGTSLGDIDTKVITSRALSADEIIQLFLKI